MAKKRGKSKNVRSVRYRRTKNVEKGKKSFLTALLLSIFVGSLGIDRFYLGYIGLGILKLLTLGGFGIWWLIDIILIAMKRMTDSKGGKLRED